MKKNLFSLLTFIFTILQVTAQDAPLVIGGQQSGDVNATLEVISKNGSKGFMPPRFTTAQINALTPNLLAASNGLTVYNTDTNCLQFWKGDKWSDCSTYSNAELTYDCTSAKIVGIYNVDKPVTDNEHIEIKVNVTKSGPFAIYSDAKNGIRFYLSTVLSAGTQTIKVPAIGTPEAAGDFTYENVFDQSGNAVCTGNPNFKTTVVENNAAYTVDCTTAAVLSGPIMEGSAANGQTLKIKIAVSKAGNYYIKSNTVNGLWLESSGVLNLGTTEIALELKGSVGTVPGDGKVSFNLMDKNNASVAQCAVLLYVSAEKATFTADCSTAVYSGGVGLAVGGSGSLGARLFYVGYTFTDNDYIKVKITVTRPGFIDIVTAGSLGDDMAGMIYAFSGYVDKTGIQEIFLRPVNSQVPAFNSMYGSMYLNGFSYLYDNITQSNLCSFGGNRNVQSFSIDKEIAELALRNYDPAANPTAEQYLNGSGGSGITILYPIAPASGIDIKIRVNMGTIGLYSFKGVANGMTLESNQGLYIWDTNSIDFKLYGTPTQLGTVVFPMINNITGQSAGSIIIKMKEFN